MAFFLLSQAFGYTRGRFRCVRTIMPLEEEGDEQGDGEHRQQGGDEGDLGHQRGVLLVFQTEDGAVGGHWHGDDNGVDVDNEVGEAQDLC